VLSRLFLTLGECKKSTPGRKKKRPEKKVEVGERERAANGGKKWTILGDDSS
jgi:hypothetical protein